MTRLLLRDARVEVASASTPTNQSRKIQHVNTPEGCSIRWILQYMIVFFLNVFLGFALPENVFQTEKTNIYLALPHYTAKCILQTFYCCFTCNIVQCTVRKLHLWFYCKIKSMSYCFSYELIRRFKILKSGHFWINREKIISFVFD